MTQSENALSHTRRVFVVDITSSDTPLVQKKQISRGVGTKLETHDALWLSRLVSAQYQATYQPKKSFIFPHLFRVDTSTRREPPWFPRYEAVKGRDGVEIQQN